MAAISSAAHRRFVTEMERQIALLDAPEGQNLQPGLEALQNLQECYQLQLSILRALIAKYETLRKDLRITLRKQQITQKHRHGNIHQEHRQSDYYADSRTDDDTGVPRIMGNRHHGEMAEKDQSQTKVAGTNGTGKKKIA